MTLPANAPTRLLALALTICTGAGGSRSCLGGPIDENKSCDLDRRMFKTAGASSSEIKDASIPGAALYRYKINRDLSHVSVVGCKPSTGELLRSSDVFELLPHGGRSAQELVSLYMWCFLQSGTATNEIVTDPERFNALHGPRGAFTPPVVQLDIVKFWRAEARPERHPEPSLSLVLVDALTGLGGDSLTWSGSYSADPAWVKAALVDEHRRSWAVFLLAYQPRPELANELVVSLESERDQEVRYLGLLALRGEIGAEHVRAIARLAEDDAPPLVRMGVVQTLTTIPDGCGSIAAATSCRNLAT